MQVHDEFSGTITLTENSSRELFKVLKEQDEAFINDVLDGRCGFTLKSADGRSVELVPNTNKRCQCVGSVGADRKTENSSEIPNNCDYAENPSGDVWECGCFLDTYCEHQIYDWNTDGTINIVECGYEPKDEPQTCSVNGRPYDCGNCEYHKCTADEPQIQLTVRCLNCNNAKACKEKHWSGCIYEPIDDEPQTERSSE